MTFVRWHYRDGVYVRSHYRYRRHAAGSAQAALLPVMVHREQSSRHRSQHHAAVPPITPADRLASRALPFPGLEVRSA